MSKQFRPHTETTKEGPQTERCLAFLYLDLKVLSFVPIVKDPTLPAIPSLHVNQ